MKYRASKVRGRAWQMERNLLRPFILRHWRTRCEAITAATWIEHRRQRKRDRTRTGRPPCDLTLNLELKRAKQMFRSAKLAPFADVKPVKTRSRRGSWFTADQIDRLYAHADDLRWRHQQVTFRALVAVMADSGLRISEALSLRWDRITLQGTTSVLGKGSKTRVVAFTPRALTALARIDRHKNSPRVFLNWRTYKPYNPSTVRAWFRQAIEAAHLEGAKADGDFALVPHILRHSFASIADERGAPASWIQQAMGHSHASTTAVYLHRSEADAALRMAAIMGERKPPKKSSSRKKDLVNADRSRVVSLS